MRTDNNHDAGNSGVKFFVNIEGTEYAWSSGTITTSEIRTLGNIPSDVPVIEEDPDGNERTLGEQEIITLKPGHRIGRAPKYRRGNTVVYSRVADEIEFLKEKYSGLEFGERMNWILIPEYKLPPDRYNQSATPLLFIIPPGYPNTGPDNFFVTSVLALKDGGNPPGLNQGANSTSGTAPIPGSWAWFSWHPTSWRPAANITSGDNLLTFMRGVNLCLQGVEQT